MAAHPQSQILTDIEGIGEIVTAAVDALLGFLGLERTEDMNAVVGAAAGERISFMIDRHLFAAEMKRDLEAIDTQDSVTQESVAPEHRPEFGGAALKPFGWDPPV